MIFSAVLTNLCSAFLSAARQLPCQTETLLVRMLSIAPLKKVVRAEVGRSALLILLRKWSRVCAFLTSAVVLVFHERSFVMCTPRNFVLFTDSTALPLMMSGMCVGCFFLKSTVIYFVLLTLRSRLFLSHQLMSSCTSSLYAESSLSLMRPTTVVICKFDDVICFKFGTAVVGHQREQQGG